MSIHPETLQEGIRSLLNSDDTTLPRTWAVLSPAPDAFDCLKRQVTRLLSMGVADQSPLGSPEGHRLEQECVRSLVALLDSTAAPRRQLSLPARTRLVHLAEELMRARLADSFGAIDLCRELGVSDRTLRLAFRERYGLGPMAYYKFLRLNAARSRIKANPLITIADVAREYGFHHLGNFAADYRRLFGESPSETPRL
ncbi:MAG: helix-turn-helix domain-containing protein [Planctomycetes bacterium]|nr:helix-turn-helix domain-containing protein [Planctomycetota bacterium]